MQFHNEELGRLNQVFVHKILHVQRAFCVVTKVNPAQEHKDNILDMLLLQLSDNQLIIGLPAISSCKLYMLPFSRGPGNKLIEGDNMFF